MGAFLSALNALNNNAAAMPLDDIEAALEELMNLIHNVIPPNEEA